MAVCIFLTGPFALFISVPNVQMIVNLERREPPGYLNASMARLVLFHAVTMRWSATCAIGNMGDGRADRVAFRSSPARS